MIIPELEWEHRWNGGDGTDQTETDDLRRLFRIAVVLGNRQYRPNRYWLDNLDRVGQFGSCPE